MTTRIAGFQPQDEYHKAGLILYADDDNYLTFLVEFVGKDLGIKPVTVVETASSPVR